jgi:hypothetical protein
MIIGIILVGFVHSKVRKKFIKLDKKWNSNGQHIRKNNKLMICLFEGE